VTVDLDTSLGQVRTDAERLRMALVNLVINACQATEAQAARTPAVAVAGGVPAIPLAAPVVVRTRKTADRCSITITDRAGGIAPEDLTRAFDPYFTTRPGGTGLGLPIAKNIIDGLGGSMTIATVDGGTEVRVDLPLDSAGAPR
jgi:signal transduction histidine kinase